MQLRLLQNSHREQLVLYVILHVVDAIAVIDGIITRSQHCDVQPHGVGVRLAEERARDVVTVGLHTAATAGRQGSSGGDDSVTSCSTGGGGAGDEASIALEVCKVDDINLERD